MEFNQDTSENLNSGNQKVRQHFINDDNFQLLQQCQQRIFEATEVSPSIRKLVNELINEENLEKISKKYIDSLL